MPPKTWDTGAGIFPLATVATRDHPGNPPENSPAGDQDCCCEGTGCQNCIGDEIITATVCVTVPCFPADSDPACSNPFPVDCEACEQCFVIPWNQPMDCDFGQLYTGQAFPANPYGDCDYPVCCPAVCPSPAGCDDTDPGFNQDRWTVLIKQIGGGKATIEVEYFRFADNQANPAGQYTWIYATECSGTPPFLVPIELDFPIDCTISYRLLLDNFPIDPGAPFCGWFQNAPCAVPDLNAYIDLTFQTSEEAGGAGLFLME